MATFRAAHPLSEIGDKGYGAGQGWDPVTGVGTPNAANLLPQLVDRITGRRCSRRSTDTVD